jgi:3-hydroxybutyryl-CoA dehydrogenase
MKLEDIRVVGVVGAGQMGRGIAQVAAAAGIEARLCDASQALADQGKATVGRQLDRQIEKGRLTATERDALLARVTPVDGIAALGGADVVIEAVPESVELKLSVFRAVDEILRDRAVLATNTSSISVTKLAAATRHPDRVIGMHFMNPVPVMKLCEIVRGVQTAEPVYQLVRALAERLGKTCIVSHDHPGFIVNRMLVPMLVEACFALQEGVGTAEDIDTGARLGLNHPLGPLELADLIGLDTVLSIAEVLGGETGDPKYRAPTLLRNLVAAGWLGRKTSRGFYAYDEQGRKVADATPSALR